MIVDQDKLKLLITSQLRFELRAVKWAPLNTDELRFAQISSAPVFTGVEVAVFENVGKKLLPCLTTGLESEMPAA